MNDYFEINNNKNIQKKKNNSRRYCVNILVFPMFFHGFPQLLRKLLGKKKNDLSMQRLDTICYHKLPIK